MMAYLYAVRCNFKRPELEAAWNEWYGGPKLRQMLRLPMFHSCQRFGAAALDCRRRYLALWVVASPDAFATPEYRAQWGFADWVEHIGDWSRDLYRAPFDEFAVGPDESLYLASFAGMGEAEARALQARIAPLLPGVAWLEAVGLDRHSPLFGVKKVARGAVPAAIAGAPGLSETIFAPIMPRALAQGIS
jgi:hypothetical protein